MSLAIAPAEATAIAGILSLVVPMIGSFLLVVKWIVRFQGDITDKYREELRDINKQFREYRTSTESKITKLEAKFNIVVRKLGEEESINGELIELIKFHDIDLPKHLDRRKEDNHV